MAGGHKIKNNDPDTVIFSNDDLDALEDFEEGQITYAELRGLIGLEGIKQAHLSRDSNDDPDSLFDDPETL